LKICTRLSCKAKLLIYKGGENLVLFFNQGIMAVKPFDISDKDFDGEVLSSNEPVLVDFWAPWCGPCKMVAPVLEEIAGDYEGRVKVVKVNVDENAGTASRYSIMSIPTMMLFKNGAAVETIVGFRKKEDLSGIIDKNL
jgi:thioredoxin 1